MPVVCGFDDPETGICMRPPVGLPSVVGDLSVADEDLPAAVREVFTMYCVKHRNEKTPDEVVEAFVQMLINKRASIVAHERLRRRSP